MGMHIMHIVFSRIRLYFFKHYANEQYGAEESLKFFILVHFFAFSLRQKFFWRALIPPTLLYLIAKWIRTARPYGVVPTSRAPPPVRYRILLKELVKRIASLIQQDYFNLNPLISPVITI